MTNRRIFALGGGFMLGDHAMDDVVAEAIGSTNARVCFIGTATGDSDVVFARFKRAWGARGFTTGRLTLFDREPDLRGEVDQYDAFYVGGGNTLNMLALWRLHSVVGLLREKYEAGAVFAGISAGVNIWHEASTTDSYGAMDVLDDGLGWLAGSVCPHFNTEPARRPFYTSGVQRGTITPGIAIDDGAGALFENEQMTAVFRTKPDARVYRVSPGEHEAHVEPVASTNGTD